MRATRWLRMLVVCWMVLQAPMLAIDWATLAPAVLKSVVRIEHGDGVCTGFVVDAEKHTVVSAAHCLGDEKLPIYVDGKPAVVLERVIGRDLLVLKGTDLGRPALKMADKNPPVGAETAACGFGYGWERPTLRIAHVADNEGEVPDIPGKLLVFDKTFEGGQSGGPIVNDAGLVVGVVQRGNYVTGIAVNTDEVRSKVGKYFKP